MEGEGDYQQVWIFSLAIAQSTMLYSAKCALSFPVYLWIGVGVSGLVRVDPGSMSRVRMVDLRHSTWLAFWFVLYGTSACTCTCTSTRLTCWRCAIPTFIAQCRQLIPVAWVFCCNVFSPEFCVDISLNISSLSLRLISVMLPI